MLVDLKAFNGMYVSAQGGGGGKVVATSDHVAEWERFERVDLGDHKIALKAFNGQYVCAEGGGGHEVVANRDQRGGWETFELEDFGNGQIALKAFNGQYVCAEGGGGHEVVANRDQRGGWETFLQEVAPVQPPFDKGSAVMQGIDTLVAMPQWYINYNLQQLLLHGRTSGGGSLQNVSLQMGPGQESWLHGTVSQLSAAVFVAGSVQKVKFIVTFSTGTMDYYDISKQPPPKVSCDISGLVFGFLVDLGQASVIPSTSLPQAVQQLAASLPPGAFTIQQLFMDFENAVISQFDPGVTKFPSTMPPSAQAAFPFYMNTYLDGLRAAGGHILGYAVTVPNTPDPVATFPPTGLKFVTNQYQGGPNATNLNPDLDTINYLLMTGGGSFPANLKPWWGNFVVPSDGQGNTWYGSMAIRKGRLVDQFLLPRLASIVLGYWAMKSANDQLTPAFDVETGTFTPTTLGGAWSIGPLTSRSHQTNTLSNDDVDYSFTWNVTLNVVPGTRNVVIQRTVDFDVKYTHWYGIEGHALSSTYQTWYDVPLTVTISLQGAVDGQLQVAVASATRQPQQGTVYGDPYGWDIVRYEGDAQIWESVTSTLDTVINNAAEMAMPEALPPNVEAAIKDNLNLKPFVFPGGAQLNMVNPVFSNEGDLLIGLSYKS